MSDLHSGSVTTLKGQGDAERRACLPVRCTCLRAGTHRQAQTGPSDLLLRLFFSHQKQMKAAIPLTPNTPLPTEYPGQLLKRAEIGQNLASPGGFEPPSPP
jgi:hypothetical protein